jgi:hypothetical protein
MKTTTWITLLSCGAILAFAIKHSPSFLNVQVVGWVLMATGGIGAVIPRNGSGGLRRTPAAKDDEEAETAPASRERSQFSRVLVPGGVISPRRGVMQPAGGQGQRETVKD